MTRSQAFQNWLQAGTQAAAWSETLILPESGAEGIAENGTHPTLGTAPASSDFTILQQQSRAGLVALYHGHQRSLDRPVEVVKALSGDQDDEFVRRQALLLGSLQHPGIAPIYDLGCDETGAAFYALRYQQGHWWSDDLAEPQQGGRLADHIDVLLRICDVVVFIHQHGLVHGDIKPECVRIGPFGEVVLSGWHALRKEDDPIRLWAGTPACMAPEQVRQDAGKIGAATDAYQLGGCLLRILSGTFPHSGSDAVEVFSSAWHNRLPVPPPQADQELWGLATPMLAEAPEDRPDVAWLRDGLLRWRSHREGAGLLRAADTVVREGPEEESALRDALYRIADIHQRWPDLPGLRASNSKAIAAYADLAIRKEFAASAADLMQRVVPEPLRGMEYAQHLSALRAAARSRRAARHQAKLLARVARLLIVAAGVGVVLLGWAAWSSWGEAQAAASQASAAQHTEEAALSAATEHLQDLQRQRMLGEIEHVIARERAGLFMPAQEILAKVETWRDSWPWKRLLYRTHRQVSMATTGLHQHAVAIHDDHVLAPVARDSLGFFDLQTGILLAELAHQAGHLHWLDTANGQLYLGGGEGLAQVALRDGLPLADSATPVAIGLEEVGARQGTLMPDRDLGVAMGWDGTLITWSLEDQHVLTRQQLQTTDGTRFVPEGLAVNEDTVWLIANHGELWEADLFAKNAARKTDDQGSWQFGPMYWGERRFFLKGYGNGWTEPQVFDEGGYLHGLHLYDHYHARAISDDGSWWGVAATSGTLMRCRRTEAPRGRNQIFHFRSPLHAMAFSHDNRLVVGQDEDGWICFPLQMPPSRRALDRSQVRAWQWHSEGLLLDRGEDTAAVLLPVAAEGQPRPVAIDEGWQSLDGLPSRIGWDDGFALHAGAGNGLVLNDTVGVVTVIETFDAPVKGLAQSPMHGGVLVVTGREVVLLPVRTAPTGDWLQPVQRLAKERGRP